MEDSHSMRIRYQALARPACAIAVAVSILSSSPALASAPSGAPGHRVDQSTPQTLTIGALLDLSGNGATLGRNSQAALNLAAADINTEFQSVGSSVSVQISVQDTGLNPSTALQDSQLLASQGVQVVIGPQTSSEVAAIQPWADSNGLLVVSHGSTASSLSNRDDNILRFVPDDTHEIQAVTELLKHDGIKAVVPLWRDDAGNRGLHDSLVRLFPADGGVVLDGASYAAGATDYSAALASVGSQVQQAQKQYGADKVAVMLASFEEAVQVFHAAASLPDLSGTNWYGTDGVAQSEALINDPAAAAFAMKVGFPSANLGLDPDAKSIWGPLSQRITQQTQTPPDASALAAYDAAWVIILAYLETGPAPQTPALRQAIVNSAGRYFGATGITALNSSGDRSGGDYDFWSIRSKNGVSAWVVTATYQASPGNGAGTIREGGS
jgi:branched-chain amino acid transport system substrate-binding protein